MKEFQRQCIFVALALGGGWNLFAGDRAESFVQYGFTWRAPQPGQDEPVRSSVVSPSELGLGPEFTRGGSAFKRPECRREKTPTPPGVVPDKNDGVVPKENDEEEKFLLEDPVLTPSAQTALAFNRFLLLGAAEELAIVGRTPSPVKKRRIVSLLEGLAKEAKNNPEQLQMALQENPDLSDLRSLLAGSGGEATDFLRPVSRATSPKKRRSFHGVASQENPTLVPSGQLVRSGSSDRALLVSQV
jgi:hypothetical protein